MFEDISHLLFLAVLLVYHAFFQDSDLHILKGVIRLVKMYRYRKVIPPVHHIPSVFPETVCHPAPSLTAVDHYNFNWLDA